MAKTSKKKVLKFDQKWPEIFEFLKLFQNNWKLKSWREQPERPRKTLSA